MEVSLIELLELAKDFLQKNDHEVLGGIISPVHDLYGKKVFAIAAVTSNLKVTSRTCFCTQGLIPSVHRCCMVKLAVESSPWIHLSEWETQQEGWSRTASSLHFHQVAS